MKRIIKRSLGVLIMAHVIPAIAVGVALGSDHFDNDATNYKILFGYLTGWILNVALLLFSGLLMLTHWLLFDEWA